MSTYGTPIHASQRERARPTQPPSNGPSLLATPARTPSALRPALFHPRASPLSLSAPRTTPATATPRLATPANTPASTRTTTATATVRGANPFDALPAAAFDTFVSGLTSSIRAVLEPRARGELPSERRKREREEHAREREEAQRERERKAAEREERRLAEEEEERARQEEEEREEHARDVFGQVKAVHDHGEDEADLVDSEDEVAHSSTASRSASPAHSAHPSVPASSSPPADPAATLEMRQVSLPRASLFQPRSAGSASASDVDERDGERTREETYGLDTGVSSAGEEEDERAEELQWAAAALGPSRDEVEQVEDEDESEDESEEASDSEIIAQDENEGDEGVRRDPFGRPMPYAVDDLDAEGADGGFDHQDALSAHSDDIQRAPHSAEPQWAVANDADDVGELEDEEETKRTKGGTELLELDSSSDAEPEPEPAHAPAQAPVKRRAPRAMYGAATAEEEAAVEQPHAALQPVAYDAAMLDALPPWLAAGVQHSAVTDEPEEGGASTAVWADVEDEGEDSGAEDAEGALAPEAEAEEWYGEGTPGDEVEMGREEEDGEEDERMSVEDAQGGVAQVGNPLELLYADEDSEDLRPRIPYEAKGKARAPPTPSDPSYAGDDSARSSLSPTSPSDEMDVERDLALWAARGRDALADYDPEELIETHDRLVADLRRAVHFESEMGRLLVEQIADVEAEFERQTGQPLDMFDADDSSDDESARDPQEFALSDAERGGDEYEGETYALPGSPLSARSASPAADTDDERAADRSAYFPDLVGPDVAENAAAEARLAEIVGELVDMRGAGVEGGMRVLPGREEEEENEDEDEDNVLVVEQMTVVESIDVEVEQPLEEQLVLEEEDTEPLEVGATPSPAVDASWAPDLEVAPSIEPEAAPSVQQDVQQSIDDDAPSLEVEAAASSDVERASAGEAEPIEVEVEQGEILSDATLEDIQDEPASPHASYAPSAPVEPSSSAPLVPSAAQAASTGDLHASVATLSAPHFSSHFQFEQRPAMSLTSPMPYPPVRTEHNVDSPVHSDDEREQGEDSKGEEAPIRVGVDDEEMRDSDFVGRLMPLARMQDGSPTRAKEARDTDTAAEDSGLVIVDDDASLPPSRPPELESAPLAAPAQQWHARVLGATPPPALGEDEDEPPIVNGVAPPQNLDIVPEPAPRTPPPAERTVEQHSRQPASAADEPTASMAPLPSAPADRSAASPAPVDKVASPGPARSNDPVLPASALSARHFSSHFQLEPVPVPALDAPVPYPPVHAEHSVDSPVHEDDLGEGEAPTGEEAPLRVGVEPEEMADEALVGRARPLAGAVDASGVQASEQEDVEMGGAGSEGGMIIIDDDEPAAGEQPAAVVADKAVEAVNSARTHIVLGATPPPRELGDEQQLPPIVDGVAPPQNLDILPDPATPSPPADFASPASAEPAHAPSDPRPAEEIRLEDFVALDSSTDAGDDGSDDEVLGALLSDRSRQAARADEPASRPILGLPADEEVVVGEWNAAAAEDDDEAGTPPPQPLNDELERERLLGQETVTETSVDPAEVGEAEEPLSLAAATDEAAAIVPSAPSQAPSSEPISYRSEDERDELDEDVEQHNYTEESPSPEDVDKEDAPDTSLHIHDVLEPGEWDPSEPIRFGGSALEAEAEQAPVVEEPVEPVQGAVDRGGSVVEVDTDGEAIQPSEIISVRGASVLSERSHTDVDARVLDSSVAADSADDQPHDRDQELPVASAIGESGRSARPQEAAEASEHAERDGSEQQDGHDQPAGLTEAGAQPSTSAEPAQPVDKAVDTVKARATPRRTRSAGKIADEERASAEPASPARRSGRLSSVPQVEEARSPKPETPAARKRIRKSEANEPASASSSAKRVKRVATSKLRRGTSVSSSEAEEEVVTGSHSQPAVRVHHHHHTPPDDAAGPSTRKRSSEAPHTRSQCSFQRLKIRSRESRHAPPYLFNVPACALASSVAEETMRSFGVENLGPVDESDGCDGIQLGGKAGTDGYAAETLHEALVPHGDVLAVVRRIVGPDLWDEGTCEVLPREERPGTQGTPGGKGKKRSAPEDGGSAKRRK